MFAHRAMIPTYFSHSYRPEDREVNEYFLKLFWDYGFAFTVDPKTGPLSTARLELMMRNSAAFVAVATRREEQPRYRCSPYLVYEYDLAVQASRPRLIFLEANVASKSFPEPDRVCVFARDRLADPDRFAPYILRLAEESRASVAACDRPLGEVGLILPTDRRYRVAAAVVRDLLEHAGYDPVPVTAGQLSAPDAALLLDRFDFVVIDVQSRGLPGWVLPFLQGRFAPSVKLVHQPPGRDIPTLPHLVRSRPLEVVGGDRQLAVWWRDPDELATELEKQVRQLQVPRRQFRTLGEGQAYVRSLGRAYGPVFISNAGPDDGLALEIGRALNLNNIEFFHYLYRNTIPLGLSWTDRLLAKVEDCRIFLPLVSRSYEESDWCRQELDMARKLHRAGRLTMIPCFLDRARATTLDVQGISLEHLTRDEQVRTVVGILDDELVRYESRPAAA